MNFGQRGEDVGSITSRNTPISSVSSESKNCQDGEDWASDRKSAKTEAEARVKKLSRASASAAG